MSLYLGVLRHSFRIPRYTTRKWHNYGPLMSMGDICEASKWAFSRGYRFSYIKVQRHEWQD
jgi:hypothetical protein